MKSTSKIPVGFLQAMEKAEKELAKNLPSWSEASGYQRLKLVLFSIAIYLPVCLVLLFISSTFLIYLYFFILPLLSYVESQPALYFYHSESEFEWAQTKAYICGATMSVLIILCLISYFQAMCRDPGQVQKSLDEEALLGFSEGRYCEKCDVCKPDRAHHCQQCGTCVLLMDHHCNWLANCVGQFNYKFFILSLFYALLALLLFVTTFWEAAGVYFSDDGFPTIISFVLVFYYTLTIALSSVIIPFLGFHVWLVTRNCTTIEYIEKKETKRSSRAIEGCRSFLGENPLTWLLPF